MTTETTSIAAVLKENTRPLHDAVEKSMGANAIFSEGFTKDEYTTLLQRLYRAHLFVEPAILAFADIKDFDGLQSEMRLDKAKLAAADLQKLGFEAKTGTPLNINFKNEAEAWGAYYVLEGSSLGGAVILKQLKKKEHLPEAYDFYGCYGDQTGPLWKTFLVALENTFISKSFNEADVLKGAEKAYQAFMDA